MKSLILTVLVFSFFALSTSAKNAVIFNFGDSNSDTGGCMAGLGINVPLPHGRLLPDRSGSGRYCDGRLVIDFLCETLNISYLSPYLEALGSDFTHGANFAISGSGTQASISNPLSLHRQVLQFLQFRSRSLQLSGHDLKGVIDEEGFKSALYMFDIGQNDLYGAFATSNFSGSVGSTVSEIKSAMQSIYANGGKNFWVHNTGPFGCMPDRLAIRKPDANIDAYGCLTALNEGAKALNSRLYDLIKELRSEFDSSTIVFVDIYSIKYDLIANYSKYGFESGVMACCGYGGPPYNFDPNRRCGSPGCDVCNVGSKYVSWDGVHYMEAANIIVAEKIISGNYSEPPVKFGCVFGA